MNPAIGRIPYTFPVFLIWCCVNTARSSLWTTVFGMVMRIANTSVCLRPTLSFGKRKLNGIRSVIKRSNASSLLWAGIVSLYGNVNWNLKSGCWHWNHWLTPWITFILKTARSKHTKYRKVTIILWPQSLNFYMERPRKQSIHRQFYLFRTPFHFSACPFHQTKRYHGGACRWRDAILSLECPLRHKHPQPCFPPSFVRWQVTHSHLRIDHFRVSMLSA